MKTDGEPHPLHFVVMTILQEGVNPNMTLYGRFCHPANEILCPVWCNIHVSFYKLNHIYRFILNFFRIIWYILVYMTYIDSLSIQHIDNLSIFYMDKIKCIHHMDNLSICCMEIKFLSIEYMDTLSICCIDGKFFHITYRKILHMLYLRIHYHCSFVRTDSINYIMPCFIKLI